MEHLGKTAKDKITGFKGVVTGFVQYLTGCNQLLIQPKVGKDGDIKEGQWLDENRVEFLKSKKISIKTDKSKGFGKEPPK